MKQRIVIVGAGGFLGSHLTRLLLKDENYHVVGITQGADLFKQSIHSENVHICSENALDSHEIVLNDEDILVNCAYPRGMKGTDITDGLDYLESIFNHAANAKIKGLINISSQSVYDPIRESATDEEDKPSLQSIYAVGKYCTERLLANICRRIPYTNIRLASLIGPGFDSRVTNKMARLALNNRELTVDVNSMQFAFLDVQDACRGLEKLLKTAPNKWKTVYNLGPQRSYSLLEIAETIKRILQNKYGYHVLIKKNYNDGELNSSIDSTRLLEDIGEYRQLSLESSLEIIISCLTDEKTQGNN